MATDQYHIGLDFGTSQTKVCVQHLSGEPRSHRFVTFDGPDGPSFFLPSRISFDGGVVRTGHAAGPGAYQYFKIAAAEDERFRTDVGRPADVGHYAGGSFAPFTPEVLSVLYLARTLLEVRQSVERLDARPPRRARLSGFLGRAAPAPAREASFTVQLGIPTEYSSDANRLRKRKFETLLVLASMLADSVSDPAAFDATPADSLLGWVRTLNQGLGDADGRGARLDAELADRGLSVFPESAAGLAALTRAGRLDAGYYAALDVGGGSTDLSFFRVDDRGTTSYLASESLLVASNDLYRAFAGSDRLDDLAAGEREVRALVARSPAAALADARYRAAAEAMTDLIYRSARRIFAGRVYWHFQNGHRPSGAIAAFAGKPCFVYGGGSALPVPPLRGRIVIHDNGAATSIHPANSTEMRRDALNDHLFTAHVEVRPDLEAVRPHGHLLAVAFGLSFPHGPGQTGWNMSHYTAGPGPGTVGPQVPHPVNADRYVYDVVGRKWFGT